VSHPDRSFRKNFLRRVKTVLQKMNCAITLLSRRRNQDDNRRKAVREYACFTCIFDSYEQHSSTSVRRVRDNSRKTRISLINL
jgi:hypothetical protein